MDRRDRLVVVLRSPAPVVVRAAERPGAEPDARDLQAGVPERFHRFRDPATSPASTGGVAAIGEVTRSSRPQAPAVRPVATAALTLLTHSRPRRAGAAGSSQPVAAQTKS